MSMNWKTIVALCGTFTLGGFLFSGGTLMGAGWGLFIGLLIILAES